MSTPGSVGVGEPSTITKRIDNVRLTQPVTGHEVERQVIGVADPDDWSKIAKVTEAAPAADALGLVVRPVGSGTEPNYDSGLVAVPDTETPVTAVTTRVTTLLVINDATQLRHLTLKDGAGGTYITAMPVNPKALLALALGGAEFASGVNVNCNSGQTGLKVQVVGRQ